jgi:hypothetical protein
MRALKLLLLFALFAFTAETPTQAQTAVAAEVLQFGLFEPLGDQNEREVASTAAGKVSTHDSSRHVQTGTEFKAQRGLVFGFRYLVRGLPDGEHEGFVMRAVHPAMTGPSGRTKTLSEAPFSMFFEAGVAADDLFYILSKDYEVLPGPWRLEVLYRGQVIASKSFQLT